MRRHTLLCLIVAIASNTCFAQQYGTLKDTRDDKIYKTYKIGECSNDKYNLTLLLSFVKNTDTVVVHDADKVSSFALLHKPYTIEMFKHLTPNTAVIKNV